MEALQKQNNKYFSDDMAYSRGFDDEIMRILSKDIWPGSRVTVSNFIEDTKHNTDFLVFRSGEVIPLRFMARIRRYEMYLRYPNDVTIRNTFANFTDGDTEYKKMMSGWGDYFFYGFDSGDGKHIIHWVIIDCRKLAQIILDIGPGHGIQHKAGNTGCGFLTYSRDEIYGAIEAEQETWY